MHEIIFKFHSNLNQSNFSEWTIKTNFLLSSIFCNFLDYLPIAKQLPKTYSNNYVVFWTFFDISINLGAFVCLNLISLFLGILISSVFPSDMRGKPIPQLCKILWNAWRMQRNIYKPNKANVKWMNRGQGEPWKIWQ